MTNAEREALQKAAGSLHGIAKELPEESPVRRSLLTIAASTAALVPVVLEQAA